MSILSLPTLSRPVPSSCLFSLIANTQAFQSPLNRSTQTLELPGARWQSTFSWQNLTDADSRIIKAWLLKLVGMAGRFYLYDFTHSTPTGTAAGSPVVSGADQTGRSIVTSGWTANQSSLLLPGDYVGIGGELKCITATAASNGSGVATLAFEPPLRAAPANSSAIVKSAPTCIMRLADDQQDRFEFKQRNVTDITISCVEVF